MKPIMDTDITLKNYWGDEVLASKFVTGIAGTAFFKDNAIMIWDEATKGLDDLLGVCDFGEQCRIEERKRLSG